jgi:hypothetical protein
MVIFICLIILFGINESRAQGPLINIDFGLKTGLGISQAVDHADDTKSKRSYLFGGLLNYRESRWLAVQIEFLYFNKGYRVNDVEETDSLGEVVGRADIELIFNYIEIPVLARFSLPTASAYQPYFLAGGFAAFNVDHKLRLLTEVPFDFDIENVEEFDYGLIAAAGLNMKTGDAHIFLETRYDVGFGKVIKNQNQKLHVLSFQIGYSW